MCPWQESLRARFRDGEASVLGLLRPRGVRGWGRRSSDRVWRGRGVVPNGGGDSLAECIICVLLMIGGSSNDPRGGGDSSQAGKLGPMGAKLCKKCNIPIWLDGPSPGHNPAGSHWLGKKWSLAESPRGGGGRGPGFETPRCLSQGKGEKKGTEKKANARE